MWLTVVVSLLIAWCVTSVPLALVVARSIGGHRPGPAVSAVALVGPPADLAA